jgi:surfactin family lipopeptide synthetase C
VQTQSNASQRKRIEAIYPLSPVQQGMLFHSLLEAGSGVYFEQILIDLTGELSAPALRKAWEGLMRRHGVLRTLFVWEGQERPLQVVRAGADVELPWTEWDWRDRDAAQQELLLAEHLQAQRRQGFALQRAPLMACLLLRLSDSRYRFVWSHHHILLDGWSTAVLLGELAQLYAAARCGTDIRLPGVRPYADYIRWLQGQDRAVSETYWRDYLAELSLPVVLGRSVSASEASEPAEYAERLLILDPGESKACLAQASALGLTLSTLFQGAWALLLHRYSGQSDLVFGVTTAGRPPELPGVEGMVGLFINTLPLRVRLSVEETIDAYLARIARELAASQVHGHTSLADLQTWAGVGPGEPLFESILVFENYPLEDAAGDLNGDLRISEVTAIERTNYPLTLIVTPGERVRICLSYDTDRFSAAQIERLLAHLRRVLAAIAATPRTRVQDLRLLGPQERVQVLETWNATERAYPPVAGAHEIFAAQAARTPQAPAVCFGEEVLSYAELDRRAERLARRLLARGAGRDRPVGLCVERSPSLMVAVLGVLKAGSTYLPLDPSYPRRRLAYMLSHARAELVLASTSLLEQLPATEATTLCLEELGLEESNAGPGDAGPPLPPADLETLAYLIYTSGSTGRPKGVAMPHGPLVNLIQWQCEASCARPGARTLQYTPIGFDVSFQELFATWAGARPMSRRPTRARSFW